MQINSYHITNIEFLVSVMTVLMKVKVKVWYLCRRLNDIVLKYHISGENLTFDDQVINLMWIPITFQST